MQLRGPNTNAEEAEHRYAIHHRPIGKSMYHSVARSSTVFLRAHLEHYLACQCAIVDSCLYELTNIENVAVRSLLTRDDWCIQRRLCLILHGTGLFCTPVARITREFSQVRVHPTFGSFSQGTSSSPMNSTHGVLMPQIRC